MKQTENPVSVYDTKGSIENLYRGEIDKLSQEMDTLSQEIRSLVRQTRSKALRRLLFLWWQYHGFKVEWIRRHIEDEAQGFLSIKAIQALWGCSRRTAYDYLHAVKALKKVNELSTANWGKLELERAYMTSLQQQSGDKGSRGTP